MSILKSDFPAELAAVLEAEAKAAGVSLVSLVRLAVADRYHPATSRVPYLSEHPNTPKGSDLLPSSYHPATIQLPQAAGTPVATRVEESSSLNPKEELQEKEEQIGATPLFPHLTAVPPPKNGSAAAPALPAGWCERVYEDFVEARRRAFEKLGRPGSSPPRLDEPFRKAIRDATRTSMQRWGVQDGQDRVLDACRGVLLSDWHMGRGRYEGQPHLAWQKVFCINRRVDQVEILSDLYRAAKAARDRARAPVPTTDKDTAMLKDQAAHTVGMWQFQGEISKKRWQQALNVILAPETSLDEVQAEVERARHDRRLAAAS